MVISFSSVSFKALSTQNNNYTTELVKNDSQNVKKENNSNLLDFFKKTSVAENHQSTVETATDMAKDTVEVMKPIPQDTTKMTNETISKTVSNSEINEAKEDVDAEVISKKVEDYKNRLNDNKWEKLYCKEDNTIHMKQKRLFDGLEYSIYPDGTVKEIGLRIKPTVILENDEDSKNLFNKYNNTDNKPVEDVSPKQKPSMKESVTNFWKLFAAYGQMTLSTAKGLIYGGMTAVTLLSGSWLFKTLPKAFTKEGPKLTQVFIHPLKSISTSNKIWSGVAGLAVFAYHLVSGKMAANQKTAVIDHKVHSTHRES